MTKKQWSASTYRANKANRLKSVEPEWVTNPDTGSEFYLRRAGAIAAITAGYMRTTSNIADEAVAAWREQGIDVGSTPLSLVTPEKIAEGERELKTMARVVQESCVLPKLVSPATKDDELDPAELDDRDLLFIFRYATGQVGSLKGGGVASDLSSFPKKAGRRSRTRKHVPELRDASEPMAATG